MSASVIHAGSSYTVPNSRLYMAVDTKCKTFFHPYRLPVLETLETGDVGLERRGVPVQRAVEAVKEACEKTMVHMARGKRVKSSKPPHTHTRMGRENQ